jgi:putative copper resistance protein D
MIVQGFATEGGWAQHDAGVHHATPDAAEHGHLQARSDPASGWEGSAEGMAYSEFNHHLAGVLVLLIGLSELSYALRSPSFAWARLLLPGSLGVMGLFLLIWSDHQAWPIGSMGFVETFFGPDHEIVQHKTYGLMALAIGAIEILRRVGRMPHRWWAIPLPLFAIVGGLMLFGHSHGSHPAAHKIFLHHTIMGSLAVSAGSSKLAAGWLTHLTGNRGSRWEFLWAGLILLIGIQLLIYSE